MGDWDHLTAVDRIEQFGSERKQRPPPPRATDENAVPSIVAGLLAIELPALMHTVGPIIRDFVADRFTAALDRLAEQERTIRELRHRIEQLEEIRDAA